MRLWNQVIFLLENKQLITEKKMHQYNKKKSFIRRCHHQVMRPDQKVEKSLRSFHLY